MDSDVGVWCRTWIWDCCFGFDVLGNYWCCSGSLGFIGVF